MEYILTLKTHYISLVKPIYEKTKQEVLLIQIIGFTLRNAFLMYTSIHQKGISFLTYHPNLRSSFL